MDTNKDVLRNGDHRLPVEVDTRTMTYPRALTRLAQDTEGALTAAGQVHNIGDVGPDLAWASFNLRAARMGQKIVVALTHGRFRVT